MRVSARLAKKLSPFNSLKLPLPIVSSIANYLNRACLKIKAFIKEKKPKNSTLRINPLKHNYGFAILGVLIVSGIGLIITSGVVKQYAHMQTQIQQAERSIQRTHVMRLIENHMSIPGHCKKTLNQVASDVSDGTNTELTQILSTHGDPLIELGLSQEELRSQYGVEGLTLLQLQCEETGGVQPCKKCSACNCPSVKWSLSLISQSYVNGLPSFNRIVQVPLKLTHTGPDDSDFECGYTPNGGQVQQGSICDCPAHRPYWTGSQCLPCPGGKVSDGTLPRKNATCVCPSNTPQWNGSNCVACPSNTPHWNGSQCVACPSNTPHWNGSQCVACPSNTPHWNGSQCVACPSSQPKWNGSNCVACPTGQSWNGSQCITTIPTICSGGQIKQGSNCVCPSSAPNWNGSQCVSSIPTCSGGQVRQGNSCICPSSQPKWNGSNCVACLTGQTWNGSNCVSSSSSCPTGYHRVGTSCYINGTCPSGYNWSGNRCIKTTTPNCPGGQRWDSSRNRCECPYRKAWNGSSCQCQGGSIPNGSYSCKCPIGTTWGFSKCVAIPTCTGGKVYNSTYNTCKCPTGKRWNGASCVTASCPTGKSWNDVVKHCVCPAGKVEDSSLNCVDKVTCSGGQRWISGNKCACPSGKSWNGASCVTPINPSCPGVQYWNSYLGRCACPSNTAGFPNCQCTGGRVFNSYNLCECPYGKVWSSATSNCITLSCPSGWTKSGSQCVKTTSTTCPTGSTKQGSQCVRPLGP